MSSIVGALSLLGMHMALTALRPAPALHMLHRDLSKDCNSGLCRVYAGLQSTALIPLRHRRPKLGPPCDALAFTGLCPCHLRLRGSVLCRRASKKAKERLPQQNKGANFQHKFSDVQVMEVYHIRFEICPEVTCSSTSGKA